MPVDIVLRPARSGEGTFLSELALRSKGHWGYSEDFLEACRAELTVPEDDLPMVTIAEAGGVPVGFFLLDGATGECELRMLFVDPPWIGHRIGGRLLRAALAKASASGCASLVLDADPGAEPFYARYGARRIAEVPSGSIPGRVLPRLRFEL